MTAITKQATTAIGKRLSSGGMRGKGMNLSTPFASHYEYEEFKKEQCAHCKRSTFCGAHNAIAKGFYNLEARQIIIHRGAVERYCTKFENRASMA